jgi:hypothetical protein
MITEMTKTASIPKRTDDDRADPETCESTILCLNNRRFVVVRHDEPKDLWPIDGGWSKLRQLQPGDEVIYKGERARVLAVDVYR